MNLLYNVKFLSEEVVVFWTLTSIVWIVHFPTTSSFRFLPNWDVRNFISLRLNFAILSVFIYLFCLFVFRLTQANFWSLMVLFFNTLNFFSENNIVLFTQSFLEDLYKILTQKETSFIICCELTNSIKNDKSMNDNWIQMLTLLIWLYMLRISCQWQIISYTILNVPFH